MKYQKALQNAITGELEMVDLTPEEEAEIVERQQRAAAADAAQEATVDATRALAANLPTAADLEGVKTIRDAVDLIARMLPVIDALAKQAGLKD